MTRQLAIALITYRRTEYAVRTVRSVQEHLCFDGRVGWYIADDGSPAEHVQAVLTTLAAGFGVDHCPVIGMHSERRGPGPNQNAAAAACYAWADQILWLEDDWILPERRDLTAYYDALQDEPSAGVIRLGYLGNGQRAEVDGINGRHYLRMHRSAQYGFCGHPQLRHRRWWDAYGPYPGPGETAGQCELALDWSYRFKHVERASDVLWPLDIPGWGIFQHIGTEKA